MTCDVLQVLAINRRVQTQNNAPAGFPNFVRDGYEIVILADDYQENQDGLIWRVSAISASAMHKHHNMHTLLLFSTLQCVLTLMLVAAYPAILH